MPPSRIVPRFVNITNPKEFGISGKDPAVRSHVTRYQWQSHHARKEAARKRRREQFLPIRIELDCAALNLNAEMNPSEEDQASHAVLQPIPRLLGGFRVDLFRSYPVWRPVFAPLVDYYLTTMAVDIPELDQPGNRGLLRTRWFPLTGSSAAAIQSVQAINEALAQQGEVPDDALIGAVAKMASYEAMFGTLDTYNLHMQGLARMVSLRGGLESLGLDGLLRRIVIWIDRNAAFLNGSSLYFPGATFAPGVPLPDPNPGHFLGAS
ncbi:hypothetical protein T310_3645 [Rasamsonia emersonii CBS 393.64]|uniref:Uncharacterized protein n=1 Tax=Rasamsonia emersonii (strain ATCC 16479 / CBS 393.64 / IMI 116815) TaxID=1408163 RepID=A0A0F4YW50_RASE3|nr:hypothetical protein T310_3645 [Rasamsonia emersonii CBS 393.64]KKA22315.1 hypothetical protein T310_3645 [Rasamsonia emersonii CBS 393.64]